MFQIFTRPDYKKIISLVVEDWDKLELPPCDQKKLKIKLLPFRKVGLHSLINFMIFSAGEDFPMLVIKIPRYREGQIAFSSLENEAYMLDSLAKKGILTNHIPQLHRLVNIDNVPVLLTKGYRGEMYHHFLDKEEDLSKLEGLLVKGAELLLPLFVEKESNKLIIDEEFIKKNIAEPLKLIVEYFPKHINEIEEILSRFLNGKKILGMKYNSVCMHREFNPWNMLREPNGNIILLDWEDAVAQGLPFLDLYNYFEICLRILYYGESKHARERSAEEKKLRVETLLKSHKNFMAKYCKAFGFSPELADFFFLIFAINSTSFFLEEKRREITYVESWLFLLINISFPNCFENHVHNYTSKKTKPLYG